MNKIIVPELVDLDSRYLVGLQIYYDTERANDLSGEWNLLMDNTQIIKNRITPEKYYQVQYWFPGAGYK